MKGSIRAIVGFLVVLGAVGGMDADPTNSVLLGTLLAIAGLLLMHSGVSAMNRENY